jgi:Lamin Tail Domain
VTSNRFSNAGRCLAFGLATALVAFVNPAPARVSAAAATSVVISEVHPAGSGNGTYNADWFEMTNAGTEAVDLTGWKMDDNSNSFSTAVALTGVASIAPGQSVVFIESTVPVDIGAFETAWFGGSVPSGFTVGTYGGPGVGLSTNGDAVNLFDAGGNRITGISFGALCVGDRYVAVANGSRRAHRSTR